MAAGDLGNARTFIAVHHALSVLLSTLVLPRLDIFFFRLNTNGGFSPSLHTFTLHTFTPKRASFQSPFQSRRLVFGFSVIMPTAMAREVDPPLCPY
jgi:hypothetical protein